MRSLQTYSCCTARLLHSFNRFDTDMSIINHIKDAKQDKQKILYCLLTDKQQDAIKLVKKHGFKRAGRKDTVPDRHKTKLYLYYLILEY